MKVKKLIKILEKQDPEAIVITKLTDDFGISYGLLVPSKTKRKGLFVLVLGGKYLHESMSALLWKARK